MPLAASNVYGTIGEFQRDYIYKFFIETVPAAVSTAYPNAISFSADVDVYNQKAVFPNRKTEAITMKWGGEFFDIPGVDSSTRDSQFSFIDDESMWVYDFFSACKDLTGNEINQAGVRGIVSKFNIGVAKVSVDKQTITEYRRLAGCRVYGVESTDLDKTGSGVSQITVEIRWDKNEEDKTKRGKEI